MSTPSSAPSSAPLSAPPSAPPRPPRLSTGAGVTAGLLLLIPLAGLAVVPLYARETPRLWGFPFFYWYELLWVFLGPAFTWAAYVVIHRARRSR